MSLTREQLIEQIRNCNARNIDLRGANLRNANLRGADLRNANLNGANLHGANLRNADLRGADLHDVYLRDAILGGADLHGANLHGANLNGANLHGANLCGADLRGADLHDVYLRGANFCDANLCGAKGLAIAADAPRRLLAVARAALQPGALEMSVWHSCETTHCMSGWAVHQAGELGRILEAVVGSHMAGLYLLGPEAASHFYDSNEKAAEYLKGVLAAAGGQP